MKVLLVEDHRLFSEQLCHMMEAITGVAVVKIAPTQAQALEWLRDPAAQWDLAVVDLFLGVGHGFTVLQACRARGPHQHAVLLTSYTREPVRERALAAGADAVFDKVFELPAFMAWVRRLRETEHTGAPTAPVRA